MSEPVHLHVELPMAATLADHCMDGRAVLPAVESLAHLARETARAYPGIEVKASRDASFLRFLEVGGNENRSVPVLIDLTRGPEKEVTALLSTRPELASGIKRTREHVRVTFGKSPAPTALPADLACAPAGVGLKIAAADLYRDLVPFGPAYRNALDPVFVTEQGAVARVGCPEQTGPVGALGSPFGLDAALHVACAWGQRFLSQVLFPLGYDQRHVLHPLEPGEVYLCRVLPNRPRDDAKPARFDIWLFDFDGRPRETVSGLRMGDVSGGKAQPPDWIRAGLPATLGNLGKACEALVLVEIDSLLPLVEKCFSAREAQRYKTLGPRRKPSFAAARVAVKQMARSLAPDPLLPVSSIETVAEDLVHPCCVFPGQEQAVRCSVAHDDRFAVAAAGRDAIGIDVERISAKPVRGKKLFLHREEKALVEKASVDGEEVATRLWTIKEAAAKALDIPLTDAWRRVRVTATGTESSRLRIDEREVTAVHDRVDDHIFTILSLPGVPTGGTN
jgi:phosphopantetheinyl transferase (holo-ACP synthase)